MLFGMLATGLLLGSFGASPTFVIALVNRLLEGLLNANVPCECSALLCSARLCSPLLASALLCSPRLSSPLLASAVLCCAVLCCAVLCCAVLCCAVLCCAVLCCRLLARLPYRACRWYAAPAVSKAYLSDLTLHSPPEHRQYAFG
jgi:hypothetical protein